MRRLFFCAAALALAACSKPDPDTRVLTYASPYTVTHPFSRADIIWMKWIETQSHGRFKIHPHWGGHLLSSNENMLEIKHGVADIGVVTPMYSRSAHIQRIQPSFYSGVGSIAQQIAVYRCLAEEFPPVNGELSGLKVLAVQGGNFPGILTRDRPVRTLADLKGLRLRAQADTADVLRSLGVDVVNMSMAEVYPAMAKGVIDGVIAPADSLRALHLADVGEYFTAIKIPRGAYPGRALSMRVWNGLTDRDRALFIASEKIWEDAMVTEIEKGLADGWKYARDAKLTIIPIPASDQKRFNAMYRANAFKLSGQLRNYGVDGLAMAKRTEELIRVGVPAGCGEAK